LRSSEIRKVRISVSLDRLRDLGIRVLIC